MRTRTILAAALPVVALLGWLASGRLASDVRAEDKPGAQTAPAGFPAPDDVQRLYDEADLNRAVQAYRFFTRQCRAPRSSRATPTSASWTTRCSAWSTASRVTSDSPTTPTRRTVRFNPT